MIPDYAGKTIEIIRLDGSVQLWTTDNWYIHFGGDPLVAAPGMTPVEVDPGNPPDVDAGETYPPVPDVLASFVGKTIRALQVSAVGDLSVTFDDTSQLSVKAAAENEAWQLSGPRGEMAVCMPGGELAIWGPRAE